MQWAVSCPWLRWQSGDIVTALLGGYYIENRSPLAKTLRKIHILTEKRLKMTNITNVFRSSLECIAELATGILDELAVAEVPPPPEGGVSQCPMPQENAG